MSVILLHSKKPYEFVFDSRSFYELLFYLKSPRHEICCLARKAEIETTQPTIRDESLPGILFTPNTRDQ